MNFTVAGGDERMVCLARILKSRGESVGCLGLERANTGIGAPEKSFKRSCCILPLPAEAADGALNAPFAERKILYEDVFDFQRSGSIVCGGKVSEKMRSAAEKRGLHVFDYMKRPEFTVGNAAITAEAAVSLLMQSMDGCVFGSSVAVVGWGRIGRLLSHKLNALGARVWVLSQNEESRAMAEALGCGTVAPGQWGKLCAMDAIINTAPAEVLDTEALSAMKRGTVLMELASAPGGFDPALAKAVGMRVIKAPGLPGRYAPGAAAELILSCVMNILKENGYE